MTEVDIGVVTLAVTHQRAAAQPPAALREYRVHEVRRRCTWRRGEDSELTREGTKVRPSKHVLLFKSTAMLKC